MEFGIAETGCYEQLKYLKSISIDEACRLDILDTAGQDEFAPLREQYLRTGEGYLLIFALDDERSFDKAFDSFWEQIIRIQVRFIVKTCSIK